MMDQINQTLLNAMQGLAQNHASIKNSPAKPKPEAPSFKDQLEKYRDSAPRTEDRPEPAAKPEKSDTAQKSDAPEAEKPRDGTALEDQQAASNIAAAVVNLKVAPEDVKVPVMQLPEETGNLTVGEVVPEPQTEVKPEAQTEPVPEQPAETATGESLIPPEGLESIPFGQITPQQKNRVIRDFMYILTHGRTIEEITQTPAVGRSGPIASRGGDQTTQSENMSMAQDGRVFGSVEGIPMQVGEGSRIQSKPLPVTQDQIDNNVETQVHRQLVNAMEAGVDTKVEMQLQPENLGKISIELVHHTDGSIQILLKADNPQTQGMLERTASGLQQMLMDQYPQSVRVFLENQNGQQQAADAFNQNPDQQSGQQPQQQNRDRQNSEDFMQQLRLGMVAEDGEEVS